MTRRPARRRVAGLAAVGRQHVRGVLAGGAAAVVAADAVARDAGVIEARRLPRRGVVAGVAVHRRRRCGSRACRWRCTLLWQLAQLPRTSLWSKRVAGRNAAVVWQSPQRSVLMMWLRGLRRGADECAAAVAGRALARRALEYRVHVTGLAVDVAMRARQLEAGREVIESSWPSWLQPGRRSRQTRVPADTALRAIHRTIGAA